MLCKVKIYIYNWDNKPKKAVGGKCFYEWLAAKL